MGGCYGGSRGRWGEDEISWDREKYTDSGESSGGEVDGSRGCTVVPYPPSWFSFPWFQLPVVN